MPDSISAEVPSDLSGPVIPVFDRVAFEETAALLMPEDVEDHLRTLLGRCEAMAGALRAPEMLARGDELANAARKLGGGSGVFGFGALAEIARRFEYAADTGDGETEVVADQLLAAIGAVVPIMRHELSAMVAASA